MSLCWVLRFRHLSRCTQWCQFVPKCQLPQFVLKWCTGVPNCWAPLTIITVIRDTGHWFHMLFMEVALHHLGLIKPSTVNSETSYISTGAGFLPATASNSSFWWQHVAAHFSRQRTGEERHASMEEKYKVFQDKCSAISSCIAAWRHGTYVSGICISYHPCGDPLMSCVLCGLWMEVSSCTLGRNAWSSWNQPLETTLQLDWIFPLQIWPVNFLAMSGWSRGQGAGAGIFDEEQRFFLFCPFAWLAELNHIFFAVCAGIVKSPLMLETVFWYTDVHIHDDLNFRSLP